MPPIRRSTATWRSIRSKDLAPISLIANAPTILVVPPSFPANTLAEFIAHLKANPGKFNYASYGAGCGPHLAAELFQLLTGTEIVHVPFNGGGPAAVGVTGNNVQMLFPSALPVLGLIRSGSSSRSRSPPTSARRCCRTCRRSARAASTTYRHLVRRAGAGQDAAADHRRSCTPTVEVLKDPDVRARMAEQGADVIGNSPAEFRALHHGRDGAACRP